MAYISCKCELLYTHIAVLCKITHMRVYVIAYNKLILKQFTSKNIYLCCTTHIKSCVVWIKRVILMKI